MSDRVLNIFRPCLLGDALHYRVESPDEVPLEGDNMQPDDPGSGVSNSYLDSLFSLKINVSATTCAIARTALLPATKSPDVSCVYLEGSADPRFHTDAHQGAWSI